MRIIQLALLLFLGALAANAKAPELRKIGEIQYIYGRYTFGKALDKDGNLLRVTADVVGADIEYKFYDSEYRVSNSFRIKNVHSETSTSSMTVIQGYPYKIDFDRSYNLFYIDGDVLAVQGLLDDEDKWVVVVADLSGDHNTDMFKLYSEDGELLYSEPSIHGMFELKGDRENGRPILYKIFSNDIYGETNVLESYTFRTEGSGVQELTAGGGRNKAYPNPVHQGQVFNIELDEPLESDAVAEICDSKGMLMTRQAVLGGESEVKVKIGRIAPGTYVYRIVDGYSCIDHGKIIVQ